MEGGSTTMGIPGRLPGTPARCASAPRALLPVKPTNPVCTGVHMEWFHRGSAAPTVEVNMKTESSSNVLQSNVEKELFVGTKFFQFLKWLFGEVILLFVYLIADCLFNGRLISDGRRFQAPGDRCQQCTCERGNVRCQSSGPCPSLTCTITEQLPGECCPRCKGKGLLMADRWCTVISKWITVSQFLFAIFLFCNLQEINWFAMTYFCNQDWRYLENNMPLIWVRNVHADEALTNF